MRYNKRNMRNNLIPQMDMMDFYNYLEFLNPGGLAKASTGMEPYPSELTPWNQKTTGYGDLTFNGEDFNAYAEGDFTTSKIEKDRKKNEKLFQKREEYLNSGSTLNTKDDPLRKKKWTLHNTSDEDMYYDKSNPTKLYTKEEWDTRIDDDLVTRSIDMLNTRHLENPDMFQKVTGYNPDTGEITYAGDKLQGDLFAEKHHDADYLQMWNPDDPDDSNADVTFTGALYEDVEQKDAAGNITHPGGDISGSYTDPFGQEQTSTYTFADNPDDNLNVEFNYPAASIGFETDRPRLSPHSQMDTMRPIPTVGKFNTGGGHVGPSGAEYFSSFDTQEELFGTDNVLPGMYDQNIYTFNPDLQEKIDEDPNDEYQWGPEPEIEEPPTEVLENEARQKWKNDPLDVFGALIPAIGQVNQILENRDKDKVNANQLANNQFATDTRDNRGITDINTGKSFEDKRVRYSQGAYGKELKKAENGDELIPISDPGFMEWIMQNYAPEYMDFNNPYIDPYYVDQSGSSIVHPDSLSLVPSVNFTGDTISTYYNPYHPNKIIDPNSELILDFDDATGNLNVERPEGFTDDEWFNYLQGSGQFSDNGEYDNMKQNIENLGFPYSFNPVDTNYIPMNQMQLDELTNRIASGDFEDNPEQEFSWWNDLIKPTAQDVGAAIEPWINPISYFSDPIKSGADEQMTFDDSGYRENIPTFAQDAYSTFMNLWGGTEAARLANWAPKKIFDKIPGMSGILGSSGPIAKNLKNLSSGFSKAFAPLEGLNFFYHAGANDIENWWPMKYGFKPAFDWLDENMPKDYDTQMMRDTPFAMNTNMSAPYADSEGLWKAIFPDSWFADEEIPEYPDNPGGYASRYAMYKGMPSMPYQEFESDYGYYPSPSRLAMNYGNPDHYSYKGEGNVYEDMALSPPRYDEHAARNPMGGDNWSADMITQYENWLIEQGHWDEDHARWTDWEDMSGRNWEGVGKDDWDWWVENQKNQPTAEELRLENIRKINKPKGNYIDSSGAHHSSSDQKKVGRDFSKPGNPFYGDWSQERVDELYTYDASLADDYNSNYGWINKRYGGNLPQANDGDELNSDGEIDLNFLNYGQCKGGGCKERGNVGFGASAFGGLEGDFTDMETTLGQLGLKGNVDLRSPMGFGANLSGEGGVQDYLSNVIEGNVNPNAFYGGRLNLGYASPEQVYLSNDPYSSPYPGFNVGAYGEYDSNRGPNFGVEGGWGPLSIMGGYNLDQQSPFFGAKLNVNLEEGGEPSRTTQLRNRQYDDIDTTIELDEDTIQELMALGAEIEYV